MKPNREIHHVRYDGTNPRRSAYRDIISHIVFNTYVMEISNQLNTPRRMRDIREEFTRILFKSIDEPIE